MNIKFKTINLSNLIQNPTGYNNSEFYYNISLDKQSITIILNKIQGIGFEIVESMPGLKIICDKTKDLILNTLGGIKLNTPFQMIEIIQPQDLNIAEPTYGFLTIQYYEIIEENENNNITEEKTITFQTTFEPIYTKTSKEILDENEDIIGRTFMNIKNIEFNTYLATENGLVEYAEYEFNSLAPVLQTLIITPNGYCFENLEELPINYFILKKNVFADITYTVTTQLFAKE